MSKTAVWFKIPGGLDALAVWTSGYPEGDIYASREWFENSDARTRRIAENRAADATGAENADWTWQPEEGLDRLSVGMTIPPLR